MPSEALQGPLGLYGPTLTLKDRDRMWVRYGALRAEGDLIGGCDFQSEAGCPETASWAGACPTKASISNCQTKLARGTIA